MQTSTSTTRINPLRKPKGFEPTVQRWSAGIPAKHEAYFVEFLGIQGPDAPTLDASPFFAFAGQSLSGLSGPDVVDHARHVDDAGQLNHIIAAYWVDEDAHKDWAAAFEASDFWNDPARLSEACGYFRESLSIPVGRQETLYWADYPAGLGRSPNVATYPTPYCGYFGAMRDRIPLAAVETFPSMAGDRLAPPVRRETRGARWVVEAPGNLAVIRSATFWGNCDREQREDFEEKLRVPLEKGMSYLRDNAVPAGCCSLRYQQSIGADFNELPEAHALGYFLSLGHLEDWSERHKSHHAIFAAAIARYKKYGAANQLRTWHEVFVLPDTGQTFDYLNCAPETGLLPWFEARKIG
ncbi:phenylacetaldoxime dehydratase family protein [Rhodobium gokarnense]|uniref:Phenylacetaldoxime dehydratase n=1 Tax=Rhodobium gokarnense TaxID=364296 RepID=A0ABT3H932_9HYPH|nr:phenylacetaldoxime dehydratase family protein [Rhodobium gokarnense]MCW2306891.1 hypothetical protein [Rhodobium gokarnense]